MVPGCLVGRSLEGALCRSWRPGPRHRFQDWPNDQVPKRAAGVYTVWDPDRLLYVGMSGRAMTAADLEVSPNGRVVAKGLWTRLNAHASGRRSGDQFCVYVADRLVLPTLTSDDARQIAEGLMPLDRKVRSYIRERVSYRFVEVPDGTAEGQLRPS